MSAAVVVNWLAGRTWMGTAALVVCGSKWPIASVGSASGPACVTNAKVLRVIPSGASNSASSQVS